MKRSTIALLMSLASVVGVALVWTRVLPWMGALFSIVIGFAGAWLGFLAIGDSDARRENAIAWAAAVIGSAAVLVGSGLFLGPLLSVPPRGAR